MKESNLRFSEKRIFLSVYIISSVILLSLLYIFYLQQKENLKSGINNELESVAILKAKEISGWLKERTADANVFIQSPVFINYFQQILNGKNNFGYTILKDKSQSLKTQNGYEDIILIDKRGNLVLNASIYVNYEYSIFKQYLEKAINTRETVVSDFHRYGRNNEIHLDFITPIYSGLKDGRGELIGLLIMCCDPNTYLYPIIEKWPTPSKTAETTIVEREGDSVVFLNNLRHDNRPVLTLKIALSQTKLPAVQAVSGKIGVFEGDDYRGKSVLTYLTDIPKTNWYMVSKVDKSEIYLPLRKQAWLAGIILMLIIILIGLFLSLVRSASQKKLIKKIQNSEQNLLEAERIGNTGSWDYDVSTDTSCWSENMFRIFDVDREKPTELVFKYFVENLVHPDDRENVLSVFTDALNGIRPYDLEYRVIKKDGAIRIIHAIAETQCDKNGIVVRLIGRVEEITERKMSEITLINSKKRFEALLSQSPSNCIIYKLIRDDAGRIVDWEISEINEHAALSLGLEVKSAIGKHALDLFGPQVMSPYFEIAKQVRSSGKSQVFETFFEATRRAYLTSVFLVDKDHYANISVDITDRKQMEQELQILNLELEKRVTQRTAQLETANKELESFSYSVSHDLRTPLRAIHGFTKILLEEYGNDLDEEGKRICGIISSNATKMGKLIDDLLGFSRIGRNCINISLLDMNLLACSVFDEISTQVEKAKTDLRVCHLDKANGDASLIRMVWNNLISNALKYSSKKTLAEITVSSKIDGDFVTYCVKDNGVGFDMLYYDKLFGVFQRLHDVSQFEGNGVGLAIVHRIISRHGGNVWAEGEEGKGATFFFSLPAAKN